MKTTKKVLGIVLAVAMLLNVFALGVFAAYPEDTAIKLILTPDKDTYAAGEDIIFTVSAMGNAEVGALTAAGQYEIAFNSSVLSPAATTDLAADHGITPAANQAPGVSLTDSLVITPDVLTDNAMSEPDSAALAKGWDNVIIYAVSSNAGVSVFEDASSAPVDLFSFKMKVNADAADGTYSIGFNSKGYENWLCYMGTENCGDVYSLYGADNGMVTEYTYEFGSCEFSIGAGKIIFHEKAQHNTNLTTADVATLGFVGNFDKNDIGGFTFVEGSTTTLANVTAVGVTLDIAGIGSQTKTTDALYLKSGSVYNFRAILKDLNLAQYGNAKITATYFVTFLKDGTPTTEYSDPVELTANGIING